MHAESQLIRKQHALSVYAIELQQNICHVDASRELYLLPEWESFELIQSGSPYCYSFFILQRACWEPNFCAGFEHPPVPRPNFKGDLDITPMQKGRPLYRGVAVLLLPRL